MSDPFKYLLTSLLRSLHSMAQQISRSSACEAHDLVQETLARALPDLLSARPHNWRAFLAKVMWNIAIDHARSKLRRGRMISLDAHDLEPPAVEPVDADLIEDIRQALSLLGQFDRSVIQAVFFEHLTQVEAAKRIGCSRRKVRDALMRARRSLRALMHS